MPGLPDLTTSKGVPQYVRIREALRESIASGEYKVDSQIPSEPELARLFGVSRMTARRAVEELVNEGMLVRRPGLGTFVQHEKYVRRSGRMTSYHEEAIERGSTVISRVLALREMSAPAKVARALDLAPGASVILCKRLRSIDNIRSTVQEAYIPYDVYPGLLEETNLETRSLYKVYEEQGYNLIWARDSIQAVMPNAEQMALLRLAPNIPLMIIDRITFAEGDLRIEFVTSSVRADHYVYEVDVER